MSKIDIYSSIYCPFCHRAKALLTAKGAEFNEIDVDVDPSARMEMMRRSDGGRTVPQIFIGDRHIGGSDDLAALDRAGELDALLAGPA
jgi:glutaredoxin 3